MSVKSKFKAMAKEDWSAPVTHVPGIVRPSPQLILRPRPEDIPALVKSDVEIAFPVECSPEIMRACLNLNIRNYRPVLVDWVGQIQSDMAAKPTRFKHTGETIQFDVDGFMLDGQNRFTAGVAANVTLVFWFIIGLPIEVREVIGFGRPRKISHVVKNMGHENAYLLSAAAGWLCKFKNGQPMLSGLTRGRSGAGTSEEILDLIRKHPDLSKSVTKCNQQGKQLVPGSLLAAIHYIGSVCLNKTELADGFLKELRAYPKKAKQTGAPFALSYDLEQRAQRGLAMERDFKARGAVEAWNLFMEGVEVEDNIDIPERLSFKDLDYNVL